MIQGIQYVPGQTLIARLLKGMRCCEGRQRKASIGETRYDRKRSQIELEKMCADHLAGDADVRKARLGAQREWGWWPALKKPLIGRKPLCRPVPAPVLDRVSVGAKGLCEMIADPWYHEWMRIGDRHQRQGARIGALFRIKRDQPRLGLDVFEILDDGERLKHGVAVVDEGRHHAFGVNRLVAGLELFAGEDIDRDLLERQPLELERYPDPERCNRPPKSVNLNTHRKTSIGQADGPPTPPYCAAASAKDSAATGGSRLIAPHPPASAR